jgi:hypothetical protein
VGTAVAFQLSSLQLQPATRQRMSVYAGLSKVQRHSQYMLSRSVYGLTAVV